MGKAAVSSSFRHALVRVCAALAVLMLSAAVTDRSEATEGGSGDLWQCEVKPPSDIEGLERCVSRSPRDVDLLLELGSAYKVAGRLEEALGAYRRAVGIDPGDAEAQLLLGQALVTSGDFDGARRSGAVAERLRPGDTAARALAESASGTGE